jgi:glycosyltransferase involved in cell wall biosynthesis
MTCRIFINGRFLTQNLSGVQRFAEEITMALGRILPGGEAPILLAPRGARPIAGMELRQVGRLSGQAWEQIELPVFARGGILINLGNTAPLCGLRQAVVIHDAGVFTCPHTYPPAFRLWYRMLHRRLVRGRTRLLTVSNFAKNELVRHLGARPETIGLIGEGNDHVHRMAADTSVLARHALTPQGFVLVVGNLAAHKNLPALGVTAQTLAARGIDLVVSGGLDRAVFRQLDGVVPRPAKYIGRTTDAELRALFESALCFIFPSLYEGFGLPAVEAMACGCPVVAAAIPALQETCGDAAIYCDPADPQNIADTVCRLIDTASLGTELRAAMRKRNTVFSWEAAAADILDAIAPLMSARQAAYKEATA